MSQWSFGSVIKTIVRICWISAALTRMIANNLKREYNGKKISYNLLGSVRELVCEDR